MYQRGLLSKIYDRNAPNSSRLAKSPRHKEQVERGKKYPTAKGVVPNTIIIVDPTDWYIADNPKGNTGIK